MSRRFVSDALGQIDTRFVEEAADCRKNRDGKRKAVKWLRPIAAVAALCLALGCAIWLLPAGSVSVTAYACGTDTELSAAGANFTTGQITVSGELVGHPLMFHLAGNQIRSVRFSCENEWLNFTDLTERRDEFGLAQNFTVEYGKDESEYDFLLIDWVPEHLIETLKSGKYASLSELPAGLRQDRIVMEVEAEDGRTAVKAITVTLNDDGTFFAAFDDYAIRDDDDFVRRADKMPIPRKELYEDDAFTVTFFDRDGYQVLPNGNWYVADDIASIVVRWKGREPDLVQMFYTPSGTETAELTELLLTAVPNSAEQAITLSADALHRESLMGHLQFYLSYGKASVSNGEVYCVIFDPN